MLARLGTEARDARLGAGLSLRVVAGATGISRSHLSRIERGRADEVPLRTLAVLFATLRMRLSARPYPEGPPLRDVAHARLLSRFRGRLPPAIEFRTEVPLALRGDLRTWDAEIRAHGQTCKIEAETVLRDLQATDRRVALKMADDDVAIVVLLVAATRRNRSVLRELRDLVRERYPFQTRDVMAALRASRIPDQSGVVVM
jgi:transcriptional regulator with XRE-family HTH domain